MAAAEFEVRVAIKSESQSGSKAVDTGRTKREQFWYSISVGKEYTNPVEPAPDAMEGQFLDNFGLTLRELLIDHFHGAWGLDREDSYYIAPPLEQVYHLGLVIFRPHIIAYGSLDFSVEIAGIDHLAKLFDGNFEIFASFLSGYLPQAFASSLQPWTLVPLEFEITPGRALRRSFKIHSESSTKDETSAESASFDAKARWLWLITNGSLVVPVLLSLGVLYVAARGLSDDRALLSQRMESVAKSQDAVIADQSQRLQSLEETVIKAHAQTLDAKK